MRRRRVFRGSDGGWFKRWARMPSQTSRPWGLIDVIPLASACVTFAEKPAIEHPVCSFGTQNLPTCWLFPWANIHMWYMSHQGLTPSSHPKHTNSSNSWGPVWCYAPQPQASHWRGSDAEEGSWKTISEKDPDQVGWTTWDFSRGEVLALHDDMDVYWYWSRETLWDLVKGRKIGLQNSVVRFLSFFGLGLSQMCRLKGLCTAPETRVCSRNLHVSGSCTAWNSCRQRTHSTALSLVQREMSA